MIVEICCSPQKNKNGDFKKLLHTIIVTDHQVPEISTTKYPENPMVFYLTWY